MNKCTKLYRKRSFIVLLSLMLISIACKTKKIAEKDYASEGYVKATVIKYEVETCGYLLVLESEEKLMPQGLKEDFQKDNLAVWIKYSVLKKQPITTCMAGKVVEMLDIVKR